jgi:hypothetical protein
MNIQGMKAQDGVVCGEYKYVYDRSKRQSFLFHLGDDPEEAENLADDLPEVAEELRKLVRAQMREQLAYHSPKSPETRERRFAPRFSSCPDTAPSPPDLSEAPQREISALNRF